MSALELWQNVTVGQAIVLVIGAWLVVRVVETLVDGVRSLAGRRTADQAEDVERAVELVEDVAQDVAGLHVEAERIRAAAEQLVEHLVDEGRPAGVPAPRVAPRPVMAGGDSVRAGS